jgi:hypothetical protein
LFCSLVRSWDNKMLGFFCSFSTTAGCSGCDYSEERWVWDPGHGRRYNGNAGGRTPATSTGVPRRRPRQARRVRRRPHGVHQAESLVCLLRASSSFPYTDPALGVPVAQRDSVLVLGAVPRAGRRRQLQRALQLGAPGRAVVHRRRHYGRSSDQHGPLVLGTRRTTATCSASASNHTRIGFFAPDREAVVG